MPVAEFPGRFGWGYDGVDLFAPTRLYGMPDDFRAFVNAAHALGVGVILDVVYNHVGPDGNYLSKFSPYYFSEVKETDWGPAINYDNEHSGPVREFVLGNAGYWIEEYHLDGLRLDATQDIYDDSEEHIIRAIGDQVRKKARQRGTIIVAENEPQEIRLIHSPDNRGFGLDAMWNDDFHHTAMVALTGRNEAYYTDYLGTPQEFISSIKHGFLYQGQYYAWQKKRRGTASLKVPPASRVVFIQNHDQVANSAYGTRCHLLTDPGRFRAMTALMLLAPGTPMLFQGQEFGSSSPFLFFADQKGELAEKVWEGRREFLSQFPSLAMKEMQARVLDPSDSATFERSKLDHGEMATNKHIYELHRDLLRLRREDPVFRAQGRYGIDGAVLGSEAFVLRYFGEDDGDRLFVVNFGTDLRLRPVPEPLLAPEKGMKWAVLWSSENPNYGGTDTPHIETPDGWLIPGRAAVVLKSEPNDEQP
jgi:maltooligosyltrehalose trehalohydrolase